MKASQVISQLYDLIKKYGDLEVCQYTFGEGDDCIYIPVDGIEYNDEYENYSNNKEKQESFYVD